MAHLKLACEHSFLDFRIEIFHFALLKKQDTFQFVFILSFFYFGIYYNYWK